MPDLETSPIRPWRGDVGRDDAGVGLAWRGDARAVRADDASRVALLAGVSPERGGVVHRDALGDHDHQRDRRVDRLDHGGLRALLGTNTTDTSAPVCAIASLTVPNTGTLVPPRSTVLPGLARVGAADDLSAGRDHPRSVLASLGARDALNDDLALTGQEDRHVMLPSRPGWPARRPAWPRRPSCLPAPRPRYSRRSGSVGPRRRCFRPAGPRSAA